jgi:hypothetical protein
MTPPAESSPNNPMPSGNQTPVQSFLRPLHRRARLRARRNKRLKSGGSRSAKGANPLQKGTRIKLVVQAQSQPDNIATLPLLTATFVRPAHPVAVAPQYASAGVRGMDMSPIVSPCTTKLLTFLGNTTQLVPNDGRQLELPIGERIVDARQPNRRVTQ